MRDSIASAAREIVVALNMEGVSFESLSAWSGAKYEQNIEAIIRKHLSHTQALQGQVEELRKALEEIASCPEDDINEQTVHIMLSIARSILAAHRGETNVD